MLYIADRRLTNYKPLISVQLEEYNDDDKIT